jgi:hypothetical protein
MIRTEKYYLKIIQDLTHYRVGDLFTLFSADYDEHKAYGFLNTTVSDTYIDTILIYETVTKRTLFDETTGVLTFQPQSEYSQVPFSLNYKTGLLKSSVGGRKLTRLISILGEIFNYKIVIEDVFIPIGKFIHELDKDLPNKIIGLVIENYHPQKEIIGKLSARVSEHDVGIKLIQTYLNDIAEVILLLNNDEEEAKCQISSSGRISIRAEEDTMEAFLKFIVETILR